MSPAAPAKSVRSASRFSFCSLLAATPGLRPVAQSRSQPAKPQKLDEEYTAKIKEYTQDPRISTELVDHLPASDTIPTPLKFFGRMPGTPGELTYAKDIQRYYEALDKASDRITMWTIGKTEEGRDMVLLAVADEATIKQIDKYKGMLAALTDPRKTTEAQAQQLIHTAKPIYWVTSGMHSSETGGPEMLLELPYRIAVEETPFIQAIRNNVITLITPVIEVDGREKHVDTYYFNKKRPAAEARLPLMYWGKYVAHDNNRDGMGQFLALTKNTTKTFLDWKPTILHDLHEAQIYLYASTGTGPYNEQIDPITIDEWWLLAKTEVMEMTKRGVPGVWTYGFYDGWVPNYMFFIAHSHNAIGRFYEVASYGPDLREQNGGGVTSREWFRPESAAADDQVGSAQQHEHPAVGAAHRAQSRRQEQGHVSRELLAQEQARGRAREDGSDVRLGHSGRSAPEAGRGRRGERAAASGARSASRDVGVQGRERQRRGRRLRHSRRSAVPHARRHVLLGPELRASQPEPVRRHGLDVPSNAQRRDQDGDRQGGARRRVDACSPPTRRRPAASRERGRSSSSITPPTTC